MIKTALITTLLTIPVLFFSTTNIIIFYKNNTKTPIVLAENPDNQNQKLLNQKQFWENFSQKTPTYQDAWLNLALINYKLKNKDEYYKAIKIAEEINPLSPKLQQVKIQTSGF